MFHRRDRQSHEQHMMWLSVFLCCKIMPPNEDERATIRMLKPF